MSGPSGRPPPQGLIHNEWKGVVAPTWSPHHPHVLSPFSAARLIKPPKKRINPPSESLTPPVSATSTSPGSSQVFFTENKALNTLPSADSRGEDELGFNGLDRFATSYTQKWLKELPAPLHVYPLPPTPPFPSVTYAQQVYPAPLLVLPRLDICLSILNFPPQQESTRPLDSERAANDPVYYAVHFSKLLSLHLFAQTLEAEKAKVYSAPVTVDEVLEGTFRLHIPGIREDIPRLNLGDRLMMRGLYPLLSVPSQGAVEAEVVGVVKVQGLVYVRSPSLAVLDASLPKPARYQITFSVSSAPVCHSQDAVRIMAMGRPHWLFPTEAVITRTSKEITWLDISLNEAQKAAVLDIALMTSNVPYLISGPPGTGKTKTLTEAVLQILATSQTATVLVCAPSSTAADTIARRLAGILKPTDLFRLNAPSRTFAEVSDDLMLYCYSSETSFDLPPFAQLMRYRVVVCTMLDASILRAARATNADIMGAQAHYQTLFGTAEPQPHWTHLLIDEAAQASEPETCIPLSVVTPSAVVVLCGDVNQLGPIISSPEAREAELDVSLLERLSQRPLYQGLSPHITHLVQNYRSIAPILMVPSSMFYDDTLIPAAKDVSLISWSQLPNPQIPILFEGCETDESWVDEGASWYNDGEISATVKLIQSMLEEITDLQQKDIAILTPWREQVWRMRTRLRKLGLGGVDVGNIETYQGREFRVTILSCVRSRSRFLEEDKRTNMGLYNERRRFNVAITRAKELLVIVGNRNLLKGDPYWNGLLQIAHRNSLYRGPEIELEMTGAYISKIESSLPRNLEGEDAGLFLAGELARATLEGE